MNQSDNSPKKANTVAKKPLGLPNLACIFYSIILAIFMIFSWYYPMLLIVFIFTNAFMFCLESKPKYGWWLFFGYLPGLIIAGRFLLWEVKKIETNSLTVEFLWNAILALVILVVSRIMLGENLLLLINRFKSGSEYKVTAKVEWLNHIGRIPFLKLDGRPKIELTFFWSYLYLKKVIKIAKGDSIQIKFRKGLLGIEYSHKLPVVNEN